MNANKKIFFWLDLEMTGLGDDQFIIEIASAITDIGFSVEIGTLFQTPKEAVDLALDLGVHVIGISSLAIARLIILGINFSGYCLGPKLLQDFVIKIGIFDSLAKLIEVVSITLKSLLITS